MAYNSMWWEVLFKLNISGVYYALLKRAGKQYRKSLKTTDKELPNAA